MQNVSYPDRLYKYESFSAQALENLKNHSIYFASPAGFNDPYDCALFPNIKSPNDDEVEIIRRYYLSKPELPKAVRREFKRLDVANLRLLLLSRALI